MNKATNPDTCCGIDLQQVSLERHTHSFEFLFGFEDQLRAVSERAGCSVSSAVNLAFAVTLETFIQADSLYFAIRSKDGRWSKMRAQLEGQLRILSLLENNGVKYLMPDSGNSESQFGLSSTSLDGSDGETPDDTSLSDSSIAIPEVRLDPLL